jgi:hypothetical protein
MASTYAILFLEIFELFPMFHPFPGMNIKLKASFFQFLKSFFHKLGIAILDLFGSTCSCTIFLLFFPLLEFGILGTLSVDPLGERRILGVPVSCKRKNR